MEHKFSAGTVERISNVLKITYDKSSPVTLADMKEITTIREQLFGNSNYASLIDLRGEVNLTKEARDYATNHSVIKKLRVAEVLLVNNFAEKLGVHTYVKFFRFKDNVTVMTDEDNALHWLGREFDKHKVKA
ncbi:MAG: hypothetical protein BM555_01485 [Crocinitomix sp. MedPE-SWsnd]|nr:MAG: hypothetical protein BM555_01485 [Crocinitomix sp. MedPE-SWsnd]